MSNIKQCLEQCLAHGKCSVNVSHCSYFCNPEYRSYVSLASCLSSPATRVNHAGMAWQRTVLVPSACQLLVPKGGWHATLLLAAFWTGRRILRSLILHLWGRGGDNSDGLCPDRSAGGKKTCPHWFCSFFVYVGYHNSFWGSGRVLWLFFPLNWSPVPRYRFNC